MSALKKRSWIIVAMAWMALLGSQTLVAANAFYETMLDEGRVALEQGERETALKKLDIACFGFLEEPPLLAEGLVFTLLAHDGLGNLAEIRSTFDRLDDLERRFQAVSEAKLTEEGRNLFEDAVVRRISDRALAASSFRALVIAKLEAELEALPPREKRAQLELKAAEEPENSKWPVRLAALELQEGRSADALSWADKAVALGESLPCLRGVALADLKRDSEAIVALASCPEIGNRLDWTAATLRAHVRLDQWDEAAALLERTDPAVLEDRDIERLAKRVRRKAGKEELEPEPVEDEGEDEGEIAEADPAPEAVAAEVELEDPAALTPDEQSDLQDARSQLRSARRVEELNAAAKLADPIAERHPESQEAQLIAGEIAYRAARWQDASRYFQKAGDPGDSRPALLFYMAVSFYESGELDRARQALARCLPSLHRTPYVDGYIERIEAAD